MRGVLREIAAHPGVTFHSNVGSFLPAQRNGLVVESLAAGASHVLFVDADVEMGPGTVGLLLESAARLQADIVCALVPAKPAFCDGYGVATDKPRCTSAVSPLAPDVFDRCEPRWRHLTEIREPFVVEQGTGLGATSCMLIAASLFRRLEPPWFAFFERRPGEHPFPEDWGFCLAAQRAGARVAFDPRPATTHYGQVGWSNRAGPDVELRSCAAEIGEHLTAGRRDEAAMIARELAVAIEEHET